MNRHLPPRPTHRSSRTKPAREPKKVVIPAIEAGKHDTAFRWIMHSGNTPDGAEIIAFVKDCVKRDKIHYAGEIRDVVARAVTLNCLDIGERMELEQILAAAAIGPTALDERPPIRPLSVDVNARTF